MSSISLPEKLSTAQRKQIAAAADEIIAAAMNTEPMDKSACRKAIERAYAYLHLPMPELRFFDSPMAAMAEMQKLVPSHSEEPVMPLNLEAIMEKTGLSMQAVLQNENNAMGNLVFDAIASAQPRDLSGWGYEEDLSFHGHINEVTFPLAWQSGWEPFAKAVDKHVGRLIHFEHAVTDALEAAVQRRDQEWLLYSGGSANPWGAAEQFARAQALVALGLVNIAALPALTLGRAVLESCGWVNAFRKLCLVCDRPAALSQEGNTRNAEGLRTRVIWRDGQECVQVWTDD
ncbi:MAG: hypothetical protein LBE24_08700 [Methylobacillus sp.]|jgi:hypothetical protein|nr:hypothetical protein [Methylobacillus sp.]